MEFLQMFRATFLLFLLSWQVAMISGQHTSEEIDLFIQDKKFSDPAMADSLSIWADKLEEIGVQTKYQRATIYALRVRGIDSHNKGDIATATRLYLEYLKKSREAALKTDELFAVSDLVYTYLSTEQYDLAKAMILTTIHDPSLAQTNPKLLSIFYNNLGIVYKKADLIDSAAWAYNQSLQIKEKLGDLKGMANLKINLSSLYITLERYEESIRLTEENLQYHQEHGDSSDLIYNLINMAASLFEIGKVQSAEDHLNEAGLIAEEIGDLPLQQLVVDRKSLFFGKSKQYEKAYLTLAESVQLKSKLFNQETAEKIAELREQYEADQREQENKVLSSELKARQNQIQLYTGGIIGLLGLLGMLFWGRKLNQKKNHQLQEQNDQINNQNLKLTQLNTEKNNLISLVSHDLSSPFSTIKVWAQGLSESASAKDIAETKEVLLQLSDTALQSIHSVLSIDKEELHDLQIEKIKLEELLAEVRQSFQKLAEAKRLTIVYEVNPEHLSLQSDKQLLIRIVSNLLSNAVKYSPIESSINIVASQEQQDVRIDIIDQGVGISKSDQKELFTPYKRLGSAPTHGESSHGLGLSIVKRLVDELGGEVRVQSEEGKGSTFTVLLPV